MSLVFNYIKKRERRNADSDEFETFYRAFYDSDGNLLRQIREGRIVHHIRHGVEIPRGAIGDDDEFFHYDSEGRVFQSRIEAARLSEVREDFRSDRGVLSSRLSTATTSVRVDSGSHVSAFSCS